MEGTSNSLQHSERNHDTCDKYDYLISVTCGAVGGIIDIFFGSAYKNNPLGRWTDEQIDELVKKYAKLEGWNPRETKKDSIASAIGFLEKKYKVNYDQRHTMDVNGAFHMNTKNHHMMSLSHSPDIVGLFFSILNQFTSTSSFIAQGKLITILTDTSELQGGNFIAKIFCGAANWFGHIMSDIAGSSGSRGNEGRGTGIVIPFYELFQFCKFGKFTVGKDKQDLAIIAQRAFEEGYDFRTGVTMTIPVVITDMLIRLIWSLRQHFQFEKPIKDCIPSSKQDCLRIMLLLGNGTLCVIDGMDAAIKSHGNALHFFLRFNWLAWIKFTALVMKEVTLRFGLSKAIQNDIEVFKEINIILSDYLKELESIDIHAFIEETKQYNLYIEELNCVTSEEDLNKILLNYFADKNLQKPWKGDFDKHMSDKNGTLIFE